MKALLLSLGIHFAIFAGITGFFGLLKTEITPFSPIPSLALRWKISMPARAPAPVATSAHQPPTRATTALSAAADAPQGPSTHVDYYTRLRARIQSQVKYPSSLARRRIQGQVLIQLAVKNDGSLDELRLEHSSGHAELDRIALEAVRSAAPFETPPAALHLSVPIDFRAR